MTHHTLHPSRTATEPTRRYALRNAATEIVGHIHLVRPGAWSFHDAKGTPAPRTSLHAPALRALLIEIRRRHAER